jgi:predicted TIM-barrel enzyme
MPRPTTREEVLTRLRKTVDDGSIIVGAGAGRYPPGNQRREPQLTTKPTGIGLSAKAVEQGGADLILIYNSGRFRMAGRGSLAGLMPYSDANKVVVEMVCDINQSTLLGKSTAYSEYCRPAKSSP